MIVVKSPVSTSTRWRPGSSFTVGSPTSHRIDRENKILPLCVFVSQSVYKSLFLFVFVCVFLSLIGDVSLSLSVCGVSLSVCACF